MPPPVLDALAADPGRPDSWLEPVSGTLLLADVSGFTTMSERFAAFAREGAELLTGVINQYFDQMLGIARARGGSNLKFGGDALLLLFQGEHHALRAAAAATAMQAATRAFARIRVGEDRLRLRMSIGLHSGDFWSGAAGLPELRMQHFILGREVARVARTQGTATAGEIFLTPAVRALAPALVTGEERDGALKLARLPPRLAVPATELASSEGLSPAAMQRLAGFLPPFVASALRAGREPPRIEGEHRRATIAFISLRGVNELLETSGPAALLEQLQAYVAGVVDLASAFGGYLVSNDVDSYGIKLILAFGAPVTHEQDAANALRFAIALRKRREEIGVGLDHRIGVNSGLVFAAEVGVAYRREYTIMGDTVNLAARLMAAAAPDRVLISRALDAETGGAFELLEMAPISVKGKSKPVAIAELAGERRQRFAARPQGILVGRDEEIERFTAACREVESGKGRSISLSGETGTGKTRLALEMQAMAGTRGWRVLQGQSHFYTTGVPFGPWVGLLEAFFGLDPSDTVEMRTEWVFAAVEHWRPDLQDQVSLLNGLLRLAAPQSNLVASYSEDERARRLQDFIAALIRASAEDAPVLLTLEDAHWADASSVRLLEHVAERLRSARAAVLATYRPQPDGEPVNLPPDALRLRLADLPPDASSVLARHLLSPPERPPEVLEAVVLRSGGNPLLIEEVARYVREAGVERLREQEGVEVGITERAHALIMSRIDALPAATRTAFRAAAVVGSTFDAATVAALLRLDEPGLRVEDEMQRLVTADFIVPAAGATYAFRHTLAHEVAYGSLAMAQRRRLHGWAAAYIEDVHRGEEDTFADVLFHHHERAGDAPRTLVYALKAGDRARQVFASEEALRYYRAGLDVLREIQTPHRRDRSILLERAADALEVTGHYRDAAAQLTQALREWKAAAPDEERLLLSEGGGRTYRTREAALARKIAVAYERASEYDGSLKWLDAALEALPPREPLLAAQVAVARCVSLFRKGLYEEAIEWGRRGLTLSRRSRDPGQIAHAHNMLASPLQHLGRLRDAAHHLWRASDLYARTGDFPGQARASTNLGACYDALGDLDAAYRCYETAISVYHRLGNYLRGAIAENNIGEMLLTQGRVAEAGERFRRVVDVYEEAGQGKAALPGYALLNLSRVHLRQGQIREARADLARGLRIFRDAGARGLLAEARLQQAELELAEAKPEAALRTCRAVLAETRELGARVMEARGLRLLGRAVLDLGSPHEAEHHIRESTALAERVGADKELALSLLQLAELYTNPTIGTPARARGALRRAAAIFRRLGARAEAERAEAQLAALA